MTDCLICFDAFNGSSRKKCACPYCNVGYCRECVGTWLTTIVDEPRCPNEQCKKAWSREFLDTIVTKVWRDSVYREYRERLLMDRERALLPATQPRIEAIHEAKRLENELITPMRERRKEIMVLMRTLEAETQGIQTQIWDITNRAERLRQGIGFDESTAKLRNTFIRRCPANNCRGFLSSAWKCGVCELFSCPDCQEVKGVARDSAHTCDPGALETAKLIAKDTKACPKCGEMITKIDGCFTKDTPILLWNGQTKMSQDISVGDTLIGDDGEKRIVQELCSGGDEMFRVSQKNGMNYTVNSKHKLALKFSGDRNIYWSNSENAWKMSWFDPESHVMKFKMSPVSDTITNEQARKILEDFKSTLTFPEVHEITVSDYMKLSASCKKSLMGFKADGVNWSQKPLALDPYLMGLWLGDGINDGMSFAISAETDPEIMTYLLDWCDKHNAELVHDETYRFCIRRRESGERQAIGRGSTTSSCKGCTSKKAAICDSPNRPYTVACEPGTSNPLKEVLDSYGLTRKKFIPMDYLVNDRQSRLQLLAGFIDTDGYVGNDGKRIQIPQANHNLARQLEFLARSLGFVVNVDVLKKKGIVFGEGEPKDYSDQLRVNISGEHLSDIPCRIARKKCVNSTPNKDPMRTSIEVSSVGQGTYYGWSIDSNKRFLLPDHTVVRNCDQMWCVSCHTAFSWRTGQVATGIVHNPHYYEFQRRMNNGEAPRNVGDIPCGGLADWATLRNSLLTPLQRAQRSFPTWFVTLEYAHRRINHVLNVDMVQLAQNAVNINDNIDLRISYLLNEISEPAMMSSLQTREKKREKELEIRRVYETLTGAATDIFRRMILTSEEKGQSEENFKPFLNELDQLRIFINEALDVLRRRYSCTLHGFDGNWERMALKMNKPKAGDETKTIYGMFVEELTKFETEFGAIVVPTALENGSLWAKPWLSKIRKLEQRVRSFPSDPTSIRHANAVVSFYENSVRALSYKTGTVVSAHHATMYERSRDRARPDFNGWKTHVTTLALTIEKPTNAIE